VVVRALKVASRRVDLPSKLTAPTLIIAGTANPACEGAARRLAIGAGPFVESPRFTRRPELERSDAVAPYVEASLADADSDNTHA